MISRKTYNSSKIKFSYSILFSHCRQLRFLPDLRYSMYVSGSLVLPGK